MAGSAALTRKPRLRRVIPFSIERRGSQNQAG
jgi:hypothetical protein